MPALSKLFALMLVLMPAVHAQSILHAERSSVGDLEVGGELPGLPSGTTRYLRYDDLLRMRSEKFTVSDDSNFKGKTQIEGVQFEALIHTLGGDGEGLMMIAICYDQYRANYPHEYLSAHHPVLVLRINGHRRDHWPKSTLNESMRPYLISHPVFKPSFKVLSHQDEPQIPYGVTRIEIRREAEVYGAIRPAATWAKDVAVQQGYQIARQDCFRCHNMKDQGGTLSKRSWIKLGTLAENDGKRFQQIIHNPLAIDSNAKMPPHPEYDDVTLAALTAYFRTFSPFRRPQ